MYTYYLFKLLKIKFYFKKYITILQIGQFLIGFILFYPYSYYDFFWNNYKNRITFYYQYIYVFIILLFFINYYGKIYKKI